MLAKRKIDEAREKNAIRHKLCDLMEIIIETLQIEIKDIRLNVLNLNFSKNCPFIPRASSLSPSQTNPKSYKQKHIWAWNRIEIIIMEMRICERNCWKVCPATDVRARAQAIETIEPTVNEILYRNCDLDTVWIWLREKVHKSNQFD